MFTFIQEGKFDIIRCLERRFKKPTEPGKLVNPSTKSRYGLQGYLGAGNLYTREIYQKSKGYDEELQGIEDLDFFWQIKHLTNNIGYLDKCLYNYFQHQTILKKRIEDSTYLEDFKKKWNVVQLDQSSCTCPILSCPSCKHICDRCQRTKRGRRLACAPLSSLSLGSGGN